MGVELARDRRARRHPLRRADPLDQRQGRRRPRERAGRAAPGARGGGPEGRPGGGGDGRSGGGRGVRTDKSAEASANNDYVLTVDDVRAFESEHGALPEGGWLLLRTGWDARADDEDRFLNADEGGMPHTPGVDAECARWLAQETPIVGIGVETVGTDAGGAALFEPPFPVHNYFLGAGKYGLTQLPNPAELPPTGSVLVAAPLKLVGGTGSPVRVIALVSG